jgi:O-antigen/teichoic acid export membrane protein
MDPRRVLNSGGALVSMQAIVQGSALVRNVVIARLVTPADFGVAATFALTVVLLDMISNLDADKLLIQAEYGSAAGFQRTAQFVRAIRGMLSALVLFLVATPLSHLFGVPDAEWAFRCIALVPLIKGFAHADPVRKQRDLMFRPMIVVEITTSVLGTLFAILLGAALRDYSLMLWVLVAQAALQLVMSHLVAERPYRWAFEPRYLRSIVAFGWPLLVNGLLLFVIFQGDRFVIASAPRLFSANSYSLSELGLYSVAFTLAMAPTNAIAAVATSLFLPLLSRAQNSQAEFQRRYVVCAQVCCLSAALIAIPFIVGGEWLIAKLYGPNYSGAGVLLGWLAVMWALRTVRVAPSLAALAMGDTRNAMISNVARAMALVGVLVAAAWGAPLTWVAISGLVGELIATAVSLARLRRHYRLPVPLCLKPATVASIGMLGAAIAAVTGISADHWFVALTLSSFLQGLVLLTMLRLFTDFRKDVRALVRPERLVGQTP